MWLIKKKGEKTGRRLVALFDTSRFIYIKYDKSEKNYSLVTLLLKVWSIIFHIYIYILETGKILSYSS